MERLNLTDEGSKPRELITCWLGLSFYGVVRLFRSLKYWWESLCSLMFYGAQRF